MKIILIYFKYYESSLSESAKSGYIKNIQAVLKFPNFDPTDGGKVSSWSRINKYPSPVFVAIYNGKLESTQELLKDERVLKEYEECIKVRILDK